MLVKLEALPSADLRVSDLRRGARVLRSAARHAAAEGLEVSLSGPDGVLVSLGTVRPNLLARLLLRSRHLRLGRLGTLRETLRRRSGSEVELVPPPPTPLAPGTHVSQPATAGRHHP